MTGKATLVIVDDPMSASPPTAEERAKLMKWFHGTVPTKGCKVAVLTTRMRRTETSISSRAGVFPAAVVEKVAKAMAALPAWGLCLSQIEVAKAVEVRMAKEAWERSQLDGMTLEEANAEWMRRYLRA